MANGDGELVCGTHWRCNCRRASGTYDIFSIITLFLLPFFFSLFGEELRTLQFTVVYVGVAGIVAEFSLECTCSWPAVRGFEERRKGVGHALNAMCPCCMRPTKPCVGPLDDGAACTPVVAAAPLLLRSSQHNSPTLAVSDGVFIFFPFFLEHSTQFWHDLQQQLHCSRPFSQIPARDCTRVPRR